MSAMLHYRDTVDSITVGFALPFKLFRTRPPGDRRITRHRDTGT